MKHHFLLFLLLIIMVGLRPFPISAAPQATITVNSLADDLAINGNCTLREALFTAALNTTWDGCTAGSPTGADLIVFSVNGVINLSLGELIITSPVTIRGNGRSQTIIDAGGNSRVFLIEDASVSLEAMTIQNGNAASWSGGGIYAGLPGITPAALLLDDVVIQDSSGINGGAISTIGWSITIRNSLFQRNQGGYTGGAIYILSTNEALLENNIIRENTAGVGGGGINTLDTVVTITHTLIENNLVDESLSSGGGGITISSGYLQLSNSIVRNNIVDLDGDGGGILLTHTSRADITNSTINNNYAEYGSGGGIHFDTSSTNSLSRTLSVENSTISGNSALIGGGLFIQTEESSNEPVIRYTTIANNVALSLVGAGGAIFVNPGSVDLTSTRNIIYGNTGSPACYPSGGWISDGYNVLQDATCGNNGTDLIGTNPLLGPLADNGGPTFTHALLQNSPAIDAAPCLPTVVTDQRGVSRPQGDSCDIGAFEFGDWVTAVYLPLIVRNP
jgi:CSLREA domain-containing protein